MSLQQTYWVLRQNYAEKTNQSQMKDFIMSQQFITCPWGGWGKERENVINGKYNEDVLDRPGKRSSRNQDRKFVEDMKIGDIVVIPFASKLDCIVGRISSNVEYAYNTNLFYCGSDTKGWVITDNCIKKEAVPFRPVGRRIEIIRTDFKPERHLGQLTLSKLNKRIIDKLNE
jgi:predicted Mrr-cat superfamily restriction endonuclease